MFELVKALLTGDYMVVTWMVLFFLLIGAVMLMSMGWNPFKKKPIIKKHVPRRLTTVLLFLFIIGTMPSCIATTLSPLNRTIDDPYARQNIRYGFLEEEDRLFVLDTIQAKSQKCKDISTAFECGLLKDNYEKRSLKVWPTWDEL